MASPVRDTLVSFTLLQQQQPAVATNYTIIVLPWVDTYTLDLQITLQRSYGVSFTL
jgi:hypothetical protein